MVGQEKFYQEIIDSYSTRVSIPRDEYNDLQERWLASGEKEPLGSGYSKLWFLGYNDAFLPAAIVHDVEYSRIHTNSPYAKPHQEIDKTHYEHCLLIAAYYDSYYLKAKAKLFCSIVRAWSLLRKPT